MENWTVQEIYVKDEIAIKEEPLKDEFNIAQTSTHQNSLISNPQDNQPCSLDSNDKKYLKCENIDFIEDIKEEKDMEEEPLQDSIISNNTSNKPNIEESMSNDQSHQFFKSKFNVNKKMNPSTFYRRSETSQNDESSSEEENLPMMGSASEYGLDETVTESDEDLVFSDEINESFEDNENNIKDLVSDAQWQPVRSKTRGFDFQGGEVLCLRASASSPDKKVIYKPGSVVVIDESVVPFRGRVSFRQYISGNSHKYGYKIYKLCTKDGYTLNMEHYCGQDSRCHPLTSTESLVMRLIGHYLDQGVTLYADNYYSTNMLAEQLLSRKTYLCGTLRVNRKNIPKEILNANLKKGEIKALESKSGVKVFNWMEDRKVLTISTIPEHDDSLIPTGKTSRSGEPIKKPRSVQEYNTAKKGVCVSDQMFAYYTPLKKTRKWYRKIAFELLAGTSCVNAWILYNKFYVDKKMSFRAFKESLILSLTCGTPKEETTTGKKKTSIGGDTGNSGHQLMEAEGPKNKTRKRCRGCYEIISANEGRNEACKKTKKVSTFCNKCHENPYLCVSCFNWKHTS